VSSDQTSTGDESAAGEKPPSREWHGNGGGSDGDGMFGEIENLSMANYRSLVESLPICLLIKDTQSRRLYANPAYLRYRKTTAKRLIGKSDYDLFSREIADRYRQDDLKVINSGQSLHGVEKTYSASGKSHWVERFKCPLRDADGKICGVQLLFWDVTARVRAEHLRNQERQWLQTLLDNMPDSIYFKDRESRFIRVGAGMAKKFDLSNTDTVIGLSDADFFSPEHAQAAREDELEIMRSGVPVVNRVERETWPDREDSWCSSTKLPLRDSSGEIIGTFGISRDITSLKKTQDELSAARDAANEANRAKSDFLANMSHEIRTPMNAIIGMSELLSQTRLTREQQDFLGLVREAADSLLHLLNDILDFSKIEASKLELERIPLSLRDTVGRAGQTLALRAAEKGLELICRVEPDIPDRLIGDPGRLRQILINLIGNALKFTDVGEVFVDVRRDPAEVAATSDGLLTPGKSIRLLFSVRDTGIGIAPEKQASVLDAFSQADSSTTRRYGGTGLGLTISSQLAKLMGGELWLESTVGVGTTFFFTAQFEIAGQQCLVQTGALRTLTDLPVLVVDDNATNRRLLDEVFNAWRLRPTLVPSGPAALAELHRAAREGVPYRLAVLDCMMPDMDGFELAARIRDSFSEEELRLVILSSAARLGDSEQCLRVGVARYLTKPVIQSELLDAILQVMNVLEPDEPPEALAFPFGPAMKILLAEDGLANQVVARGLLQMAGHEVVIAADGREAIRLWAAEPFDAILMDMHMPDVDGLEATREIRRIEAIENRPRTPIIAVTAAAMSEDTRQCLEAGMDAFLAKPIQANLLHQSLAAFAGRSRSDSISPGDVGVPVEASAEAEADAQPEARSGEAAEPASETERQDSHRDDGGIDLEKAAAQMPGGTPAMRQLAIVFIAECRTILSELGLAVAASDAAKVRRLAHTLHGSSKLFFASRLGESSFALESAAAANRCDHFPALFSNLRQDEAEVRQTLEDYLSQPL
jgi:two-component system, sensor histidine kinase and response regulator